MASQTIFTNFASQTAPWKPGQGQRGRVGRHFEKRLLDTLS